MLGRRFQLVTWLIRLQRNCLVFLSLIFGRMKGSGKLKKVERRKEKKIGKLKEKKSKKTTTTKNK